MKKTADVIIIGGGINGCATAYYLAKRGIKDVLVLEADDSIGHGGSSRNGGGVRQSGRDVRELPYAMYAVNNMWPTLSEELGVDVEYYQRGNLRLGKTEAHLKKLETLASNARSVGLDMHVIDGKEVKEICPHLSDEVIGASWCPTDGHANPMKTTLAFYTRSLELGARYITGAKVKAIEKVKGKARKVILTTGEVFEGETIILAAGYESRFIARTVGIDVPMTKFFEECLVTEMQMPISMDISHSMVHLYSVRIPVWKNRLINRLTICAQHRLLLQQDAARLWDTFRNWQMPKLSAHGAAGVICALTAYRLSTV